MLLAINIGNTNITSGLFETSEFVDHWKIGKEKLTELENKFSKLKNIEGIIISSVVPQITPSVFTILKKLRFVKPLVVTSDMILPIKINVDHPEKVGSDLIANMIAAKELYRKTVIVLDCGTATTFCTLSKNGEFTGSVIAPGLRSMAKSLTENAALLPSFELIKPKSLIGHNTIEAMQSGVYFGYTGLIKEILNRLKKENPDAMIVATGGNIKSIIDEISDIDVIEENLTLKGLQIIYRLNV